MARILIEISIGLALLNVAVALFVIGNRFVVRARSARYEAAVRKTRPAVFDWIEGEQFHPLDLTAIEREAFVDLLAKYGRSLRGDGRLRLTEVAELAGVGSALAAGATSRRAWKRAAAVYRLGDIGHRDLALLVSMLDDPDRRVRNAAARSLGKQGAVEGVEPIVLALSAGAVSRAIGGQALIDIGAPAAESLVRLLDSRIREVRATAAELLGRVGNIEHAKILTVQLNHPDAEVRVAVVRALGRLGGRLAAQSVQSLLSDPVPYVRAAAATAVGRLGGAGAIDRLIEMATDDEFLPAHAAAMAAKELDPERVMAVAAAGTSPHLVEASDLLEMASP